MLKLKTLYFWGVKNQSGVLWGHRGQILIFTKMHYLFYVTKYIHVIHILASHLREKQGNWGQSGVKVLKPAGYAVCDGNMSSSSLHRRMQCACVLFLLNSSTSFCQPHYLMFLQSA